MTDEEYQTICARLRLPMDDPARADELRAWLEDIEPTMKLIYDEHGSYAAALWVDRVKKYLETDGEGYRAHCLDVLLMCWIDEKDRVNGGVYTKEEYKRIIDGVESGKVPDDVWLYRFHVDIKGIGIEEQLRSIIKKLKEKYKWTNTSIAHAVGMDETSLSKFLDEDKETHQDLSARNIDLLVRHFAIVLTPLCWLKEVPFAEKAAGRRRGRSDKGKKRK
jgi:hypothetical protein